MLQTRQKMEISVHLETDIDACRDDWLALQSRGATTLYQTFEWCSTWQRVAGTARGSQPLIVIGRGNSGEPVFILPLSIETHGSCRVIEWMAGNVVSYGFGLFDTRFLSQDGKPLEVLWSDILAVLPPCDCIWLRHLPEDWHGFRHPLSGLFSTKSANVTHQISLSSSFDELYAAKRSSSSRRGAHKRDKKLKAAGDLAFGTPQDAAETCALIDAIIAQQAEQLALRGIHNPIDPAAGEFLKAMASGDPKRNSVDILPQFLKVDGELIAAKLGFVFDDTYWAIISSLGGERLQKFSPGDYALRRLIESCCERGLATLDFATGDSDYKHHWADRSIELHELFYAQSAKGKLWCARKRAAVSVKRHIKSSTFWWPKLLKLRRLVLGSAS